MTILTRNGGPLTRRRFLTGTASSAAIFTTSAIAKPFVSRAADRPVVTHGVQSGDVSIGAGVVWARADRPARRHRQDSEQHAGPATRQRDRRPAPFHKQRPENTYPQARIPGHNGPIHRPARPPDTRPQ